MVASGVLAAAAAGVFAFGTSNGNAGTTVTVGNITSVAGLGGTFTGFQNGVKAFFKYYNAHGGINGTKVNLVAFDDAADPAKNTTDARTLVESDNVLAIVGEASLADAASQKYLQAAGVPVVGGWATSSAWERPSTNMFVSLQGPQTPYCGLWPLDYLKGLGIQKVAFVDQAFADAEQDANCRIAAAKHVGLTVVGKRIDMSLTAATYTPAIQQAMADHAQAIMFSTGADGILAGIKAGQQLGFKGDYIVTQTSGLITGIDGLGLQKAVSGRVFSSAFSLLVNDPASVNAEFAKYKAAIKQYYPASETDVTSVSGWAAAKEFADALTAAGPSRSGIIKWLSKQSAYNFGGLQGPVNYTHGSLPNACTTRVEFKNNEFVRVPGAAPAPKFNCNVLINPATGAVDANNS